VKVVGIGGGHGLAVTLTAGQRYADEVSAVVTVADDGGSSGRLTRELGIPPPGDIRNCLAALAPGSELADVFQHRFGSGALAGHAVGNLVIAALAERCGDFGEAVERTARLVGARGEVWPCTTELVGLRALVSGGIVEGQVAVGQADGRIEAVSLVPADPGAHPAAVEAILAADLVVLGPGSLYTSLVATLLVPGVTKALMDTRARRVFVCNTRMQERETSGLDATAHVEVLVAHTGPGPIDSVVVQRPELSPDGVRIDPATLASLGFEVVEADIAAPDGAHDPERLSQVLARLGRRRRN
jgi:uncharacterized cofD-like protein